MRQEFSIIKRHGKNGPTYYVRYFQNNKMIPSQWSTKTDIYEKAIDFSRANREKLLKKYFHRKEGKTLFSILKKYYIKNSSYLIIDAVRGRKLNDSSRKILHGFILNTFIPFLQKNNIKEFEEINAVLINRFQNYLLLEKNILPQSINRQIGGIKAIFSHLFMTGVVETNLIKDIVPLRTIKKKIRECYSLDELEGIFKNEWPDRKMYLLCALIYTTGMRNSEIQNLKVSDVTSADTAEGGFPLATLSENADVGGKISFLSITRSKTSSGIRKVPLHRKVKEVLDLWIAQNRLSENNFLFVNNENQRFYRYARNANNYLGSLLGKTPEELFTQNITFYSGRHFYKTMLNNYNLGDVEELFMGHSVNKNVSEIYNHKNKRGERELLKAAARALEIIDECLFR